MLEIVVAGPSIYYIGKGGAGTHAQLLSKKHTECNLSDGDAL